MASRSRKTREVKYQLEELEELQTSLDSRMKILETKLRGTESEERATHAQMKHRIRELSAIVGGIEQEILLSLQYSYKDLKQDRRDSIELLYNLKQRLEDAKSMAKEVQERQKDKGDAEIPKYITMLGKKVAQLRMADAGLRLQEAKTVQLVHEDVGRTEEILQEAFGRLIIRSIDDYLPYDYEDRPAVELLVTMETKKISMIYDMCATENGMLAVVGMNHNVVEILNPSGHYVEYVSPSRKLKSISAVVKRDGWSHYADPTLRCVASIKGRTHKFIYLPGADKALHKSKGSQALGLALDQDGNIYISSERTNTIYKMITGTSTPEPFIQNGEGTPLSSPLAMCFKGDSQLLVSNWASSQVRVYNLQGELSHTYGSEGRPQEKDSKITNPTQSNKELQIANGPQNIPTAVSDGEVNNGYSLQSTNGVSNVKQVNADLVNGGHEDHISGMNGKASATLPHQNLDPGERVHGADGQVKRRHLGPMSCTNAATNTEYYHNLQYEDTHAYLDERLPQSSAAYYRSPSDYGSRLYRSKKIPGQYQSRLDPVYGETRRRVTSYVQPTANICDQHLSAHGTTCNLRHQRPVYHVVEPKDETNSALWHPKGVCCDENGNTFIADSSNHRVQIVTKSGEIHNNVITKRHGIAIPWAVTSLSGGKLAVSHSRNKVTIFRVPLSLNKRDSWNWRSIANNGYYLLDRKVRDRERTMTTT